MTMRILYPMPGNTLGGSHISTLEIIRCLDTARFTPIIALHETTGLLAKAVKKFEDVSSIFYPLNLKHIFFRPICFVNAIFKAKRFIIDHKIDIVQCDDGALRHVWFYAARLSGARYIHVQQTLPSVNFEKRLIYPHYDARICCSQTVAKAMPKGTVCDVAYPIVTVKNLYEKNKDITIGFAANIRQNKRPMIFIEMAHRLHKKNPAIKFFMAGDFFADFDQKLSAYAEECDLTNNIDFLGFREDVQELIARAHILVVPAVNDAFGRTLVEAMMLGTPVIAADSGGHREIIKHGVNGFLAKVDDVDDFVRCALTILGDQNLKSAIIKAAKKEALDRFSSYSTMNVYIRTYERLIKQ